MGAYWKSIRSGKLNSSSLFEEYGDQIAGIVTEFPTNPLLQSGDLQTARSLCDQAGALLIIDPTMASPKNAKITSLADVVVNSLTKYAGWEGDVMMGSLAFPQSSALGQSLFEPTRARICPPYKRDLCAWPSRSPPTMILLSGPINRPLRWLLFCKATRVFEKFIGLTKMGMEKTIKKWQGADARAAT